EIEFAKPFFAMCFWQRRPSTANQKLLLGLRTFDRWRLNHRRSFRNLLPLHGRSGSDWSNPAADRNWRGVTDRAFCAGHRNNYESGDEESGHKVTEKKNRL